jgi:hypothetical protein
MATPPPKAGDQGGLAGMRGFHADPATAIDAAWQEDTPLHASTDICRNKISPIGI